MTAAVIRLVTKHAHACDQFRGYGRLCLNCQWAKLLHAVFCSQCGNSYIPRRKVNRMGFSDCTEHLEKR